MAMLKKSPAPPLPEVAPAATEVAAAPASEVPAVSSFEEALRTLVAQYHARCCNSPRWQTCKNPECVAVQQVIK